MGQQCQGWVSKAGSAVCTGRCQLLVVHTVTVHLCQAIPIDSTLKVPSGVELMHRDDQHPACAAVELPLITQGNIKKKSFLGVNPT